MPVLSILLADDEALIRMAVSDALRDRGHQVTAVDDGAKALEAAEGRIFDLVICDIRLPSVDGLTVFRKIHERTPKTEVVLITAYGSFADAVAVIKEGAYDYMTKPFEVQEIVIAVERIAERRQLRRDLDAARAALAAQGSSALLVGHTPGMQRLQERIDAIADSSAAVLITAESGTGKELVARAIHDRSPRRDHQFVAINCAAFPETLIEAELFGHERGAFTGASGRRDGRFKLADGGTLLFDEIEELPLAAQAKLLRVLQEGTFEPIGSNTTTTVDVRLISTSNRNLKEEVAKGTFREDLYYRINVLEISIPPLRERRGDISLLAEHFLRRFYSGEGEPPSLSPAVCAALDRYHFPGNVREFMHTIEHALVFCRGREVRLKDLPPDVGGGSAPDGSTMTTEARTRTLSVALKEFEQEYVTRTLEAAHGKRTLAAEMLGISRKNLWEKLRHLSVATDGIES